MGEIADMMVDRMMEDCDYDGHEFGGPLEGKPVECKYCKAQGVVWEQTPSGWRLFNKNGSLHECIDPFKLVKTVENIPRIRHGNHRKEKASVSDLRKVDRNKQAKAVLATPKRRSGKV